VIEGVVAVVGREAIFASELRARAKPFLQQVDRDNPDDAAKRAAARAQATSALLDRMIEERLIAGAANKARIAVTPDEVDRALDTVASAQKLTRAALLRAAGDKGLQEQAYRDELRRQVLEGKVLMRRVKGYAVLSASERIEAMAKERDKLLAELRQRTFVERRL